MNGTRLQRRLLIIIGVLAVVVGACSPSELTEQIIESQEGVGDIEIDESSGEVSIEIEGEDGDGSVTIGGGEVPDDFPIPVASGGEVRSVFEVDGEYNVQISYPGSQFDSLKEFYEDWASGAGSVENTFESSNPPTYGVTVIDDDRSYTVAISEVGEEVILSLLVGRG